jgi:hypothetical protein
MSAVQQLELRRREKELAKLREQLTKLTDKIVNGRSGGSIEVINPIEKDIYRRISGKRTEKASVSILSTQDII